MDSILLFGNQDEKLEKFLKKMGYRINVAEERESIVDFLRTTPVDLIVVDSRLHDDATDICEYLRKDKNTRDVPIVYLAQNAQQSADLSARSVNRLEVIPVPYTPAVVLSRIATQLRLRKMHGSSPDVRATLSETNAALRDLTERLTRELDEARKIQEGLLPKSLPKNPALDIAASYQPLEEVGGDWYFVRQEKSGKLSLHIADVTGHGLSAAFIGSMTKLAMAAAARENPAELLKEMNRLMAQQIPEGRFVTMGSVLYDPSTGKFDSARAGHPPALVLNRRTNKVSQFASDGFAIGFFEEADYSASNGQLEINDLLMLITDGISEGQNRKSENYGLDRLSAVLAKTTPEQSAAEVVQKVLLDFDHFRDGRILKDDVTILVLKRVS